MRQRVAERWPLDGRTVTFLLRGLWRSVGAFANGSQPTGNEEARLWRNARASLISPPPRDSPSQAMPLRIPDRLRLFSDPTAGVRWEIQSGQLTGTTAQTLDRHGRPVGAVQRRPEAPQPDLEAEIRFALLLLRHPAARRLLRRCAACGRFVLLKAARPSTSRRYYCTPDCRKAWDKSMAARASAARRQLEHRKRNPSRHAQRTRGRGAM